MKQKIGESIVRRAPKLASGSPPSAIAVDGDTVSPLQRINRSFLERSSR